MKLNWRIWLLGIFVILSIISILGGDGSSKFLVFVLLTAVLFILHYSESKIIYIGTTIILLIISGYVIMNSFESGVIVKSVGEESPAAIEGLKSGEIIKQINGINVEGLEDYFVAVEGLIDSNQSKKINIVTKSNDYTFFTNQSLDLTVADIEKTHIRTGLDLRGGARALVQPEIKLSDSEMNDLVQIARNRFNVYGLSDVQVKAVSDAENNKFILVEVAGTTPKDLEDLIAKQGKFEAKIANKTVFEGGKKDIADVCRNDATCAAVTRCLPAQSGGFACEFDFTVYLTEKAAQRHADVTRNISLDETGSYLAEKIYLYVDQKEVDVLSIGADLRGQVATRISIRGSGTGSTQDKALIDAKESMKRLQTVLITGSLPYKLNIVKLDTISPVLGKDFSYLIILAGIASLIAVSIIIFIRYRKFKASLALLFTSFSEVVIILGFASLIKWNLDLPSIAGILATIGTGVDSQIVIIDEAERGKKISMKDSIARALFIILSVYATALASLIPLFWAGASLFQGFAITSIIGVSAGVFISRPAFAEMIKKIEE